MTHIASPAPIPIRDGADILLARKAARELAVALGLGAADQTRLATAVSELTRNVLQYAGRGLCRVVNESDAATVRICVEVADQGPGISDLELAMRDGYSTSGGLGAGLPGTRRLMDEFKLESRPSDTRVTIRMIRARR
jgi:serine/threonine-protein kinase RsbT